MEQEGVLCSACTLRWENVLYQAAWECCVLCLAKEMFGFVAKSSHAGLVKQLRAETCAMD